MASVLAAQDFILKELYSGQASRYRWRRVYNWVRQNIPQYISTTNIQRILRLLNNASVEARRLVNVRRWRKRYTVRGLNRIWSVDGHNKLSEYGFQIYGIINAYSQYIIGCYVGISNRTQIAV
jgi:hypothetical protein